VQLLGKKDLRGEPGNDKRWRSPNVAISGAGGPVGRTVREALSSPYPPFQAGFRGATPGKKDLRGSREAMSAGAARTSPFGSPADDPVAVVAVLSRVQGCNPWRDNFTEGNHGSDKRSRRPNVAIFPSRRSK
jgi:hypothetical protein